MEHKETKDAYEFCEWLYVYLHSRDSEYVDKAIISERLDKTEWIRMTKSGMEEIKNRR